MRQDLSRSCLFFIVSNECVGEYIRDIKGGGDIYDCERYLHLGGEIRVVLYVLLRESKIP